MTEFLQGIEVLNATEITTCPDWIVIFFIGAILSVIIFVGLLLFDNLENICTLISGISFLVCTFGLLIAYSIEIPTGKYVYQVTIDETVSFQELYEHYEIIDQQGKIYTIREKK